ncbi:MAG: CNP1-like family protein [Gammaproteobacteria bacterium]
MHTWRADRFVILRGLLAAALAVFAASALADDGQGAASGVRDDGVALPAFPRSSGLLPVPLDLPDYPFKLSIDPAALSVGPHGVVRYTVVLTSHSGARNVFYEGVNCFTGHYKRYAFGTSDGHFERQSDATWKRIYERGGQDYLYQFYNFFLCNPSIGPLPRHQILQRIMYQSR